MKDWLGRSEILMKDVIDDIKKLPIDADRTSGLNPDSIDQFNKLKAKFFSENIINLERKDYSTLVVNQLEGSEVQFVRGIQSLLQENDYDQMMGWQIPKPITLPDDKILSELCRYSYVKRFLVKEMTVLNKLLEKVREEIDILKLIESGMLSPDPNFSTLKQGLLKGVLPDSWHSLSSCSNQSLKSWREIIKLRHNHLSRQAVLLDRDSRIFSLRWFANPRGLLEAITLDAAYRRAPSTKFNDIMMIFKTTNIFERNIEQLSEEEYHVYGLKVKNGYIDKTKSELTDKMEPNCTDEFPAILVQCRYVKRAAGEKTESKGYVCPVVSAYEHLGQRAKEQTVLFKLVGF